jgi:hypothetical protein
LGVSGQERHGRISVREIRLKSIIMYYNCASISQKRNHLLLRRRAL